MKLICIFYAGALLFAGSIAQGADAPKNSVRADRAASQPGGTVSPPVRASENAEMPGDLRPEKRPAPQIAIPLKGKARTGSEETAGTGSAIDDGAARCLAKKTKRERAQCQREGAQASSAAAKR